MHEANYAFQTYTHGSRHYLSLQRTSISTELYCRLYQESQRAHEYAHSKPSYVRPELRLVHWLGWKQNGRIRIRHQTSSPLQFIDMCCKRATDGRAAPIDKGMMDLPSPEICAWLRSAACSTPDDYFEDGHSTSSSWQLLERFFKLLAISSTTLWATIDPNSHFLTVWITNFLG